MAVQISEPLQHTGITLLRSALAGPKFGHWKSLIDACYEQIETARRDGDSATIARLIGARGRFALTASSFTISAALSDQNIGELLSSLATGPSGTCVQSIIGNHGVCDLDESWVRRQYAPCRYPPAHAPHGWHQDGALKFDFLSHPDGKFPSHAMLNMVTCWITLDSCGIDAPGLELISKRLPALLPPAELRHEAIQARFESARFSRPILEPGDALLFAGDVLHRTHVSPAMTKDRTSIELRFFPTGQIPERLKSDRFVPLS